MGNQSSQLGDEPSTAIAQKNLAHFDHSFKADIHTTNGHLLTDVFGPAKFAKRSCTLICKGHEFDILEEQGLTSRKQASFNYSTITAIGWDHSNSEVKLNFASEDDSFVILSLANSIEFEGELKLRLSGMASQNRNMKIPSPTYVGMFAGATKPKPFQRKRPNISHLPSAKLPTLHDMRSSAIDLHKGSYRPCPHEHSRRLAIAFQHIYEGQNTFALMNVRGASSLSNQFRSDSVIVIGDEALTFKPGGVHSHQKVEFAYEDLADWNAIDNDTYRLNDSGIELVSNNGDSVYFGVAFIRDVKHTLEYYWNKYKVENGGEVKLGSTHGRPIVSIYTLSGEIPPNEHPATGQCEVVDQDGILVRPGGRIAPRRASITAGVMTTKENRVVPPENKDVKKHWHKVVLHQGWLLKQGGVGVGTAKGWIKRYFVLYATSQGHFLVYYSDFTECPMYTSEKNHRNVVDLAKATFIRPGSNKADNPETPPYCFDIVTTEREWTLCAESQDNAQKWLKLLTRSVDEDVAILPDEELIFNVKPKVDPLGILPSTDYSTKLKISAQGIAVTTPDPNAKDGAEKEHYFWVYTDFYKWSLLSQAGKLALLVNVFADSSFSRRYEYIFRHKEAQRLATAIEYFIEKFMTVMHVRLETTEGAFDAVEEKDGAKGKASGLHVLGDDEAHEDEIGYADEDLLGMEVTPAKAKQQSRGGGGDVFGADPFGDDPFGEEAPAAPVSRPPAAAPQEIDLFGGGFGDDLPVVPPKSAPQTNAAVDLFGDDPFGASNDPFGGSSFAPPAAAQQVKLAPPLSPQQIGQHKQWRVAAVSSNGGPIYDDGCLQVSCKIELRGSQCRFTFLYNNQSVGNLTDFSVAVTDAAGLMRFELPTFQNSLSGLAQGTQIMMLECVKPAAPGPTVTFSYTDKMSGKRSNTIDLPLIVTSFNEPLQLAGDDFMSRWSQLTAPGQEAIEILKPTYPLVPQQIQQALVSTLKFGRVHGIPDATEFVIYGAASLRTGATTATGEKINVGCLVKIEMNVQANAMRVTLRTLHPAATAAILLTAKSLLV